MLKYLLAPSLVIAVQWVLASPTQAQEQPTAAAPRGENASTNGSDLRAYELRSEWLASGGASTRSRADEDVDGEAPTGSFGAKLLGGVGGLAVGVLAYSLTGAALADACDRECGGTGLAIGAVALAGLLVAMPYGVTLAGDASGGNGTFLGAFLGGAIGTAVDAGVILALMASSGGEISFEGAGGFAAALLGLMLIPPIAGAIIGYGVSARPRAAAPRAWTMTPTASIDPHGHGASLGLSGTF